MTKQTEALKLALEALVYASSYCDTYEAITVLREALAEQPAQQAFVSPGGGYVPAIPAQQALDKMAENARELGLDYEPSAGTQVSKVWWDGEKLMAKPIPLEDFYKPAQQEPVAWMFQHDETGRMNYVGNDGIHNPTMFLEMNPRYALVCPLYTSPPAQRTWVGLTNQEREAVIDNSLTPACVVLATEAKLKEKNT